MMNVRMLRILVPFFAVVVSGCCSTSAKIKDAPKESVHVEDVVTAIQKAIDSFWNDKDLPLSSVKVALQTVHDNRISGEADYLIVAVKGYYDAAQTQEIDFVLTPQKPPATPLAFKNAGPNIEKELREAIAAAKVQIAKAYNYNNHVLNTSEIDVQIAFAVTWDVSSGVSKWEILPISVSASDEYSSKTTNTITVTFKKG